MNTEKLYVYTTSWCSDWQRVRQILDARSVPYIVVDIEEHPEAAAVVLHVNDGRRRVPTLVFPDGSTLTEPSNRQLTLHLERQ